MPLAHVIEVNALTLDGADGPRLTANWSWAGALLDEAAVRDLAQTWLRALEALTRHAAQPGAGGSSPSDVALADLSQDEIERLERQYPRNLEDILPLSPLQEGLLFHALYDAQRPDVYTVQLELELEGALDPATLQAALQAVVGRHASLRSGFRHERLGHPVQVVLGRVEVPWRLVDLSECDGEQQRQHLVELLVQPTAWSGSIWRAAVAAVCADQAFCAAPPAADQQPSPFDGRLVGADPGAGTAGSLCAGWQRGVVAAGDAVSRLSRLHGAAGPRRWACGVASGAGRP